MRNMPLIVQAVLEKIFKMVDGWKTGEGRTYVGDVCTMTSPCEPKDSSELK